MSEESHSVAPPIRRIARIVIQFVTPFHVGAGREGETTDAIVVTDVNGLPAIPGSSIAGVLRSALWTPGDESKRGSDICEVFGYQSVRKAGEDYPDGRASRLRVSWGCIHDSQNTPVEGIASDARLKDEVLVEACLPAAREHTAIHHRGAADSRERGLFTEHAVCAGHRFTFEMELIGNLGEEDARRWLRLLDLLRDGSLRLGGKSRRGFGAFRIEELKAWEFDLERDFAAYADFSPSLAETPKTRAYLSETSSSHTGTSRAITATLRLTPRGYWMFGGGSDIDGQKGESDASPVRAHRIVWQDDIGRVQPDLIILPGAGIKGAIAHRVAFHYNAITGRFADGKTIEGIKAFTGSGNTAVAALFGFVNGNDKQSDASRGRVMIDDVFMETPPQQQLVHHVSIDRFTGGALPTALYSERPLWSTADQSPICMKISVSEPGAIDAHSEVDAIKAAFLRAINDLAASRLQIGAGSGRGYGYFEGGVEWSDGGAWMSAKTQKPNACTTS